MAYSNPNANGKYNPVYTANKQGELDTAQLKSPI